MDLSIKTQPESNFFLYKYYRIVVIPLVFLVYLSMYYLVNPYQYHEQSALISLGLTLDIVVLLIYCSILTELSLLVGRSLNRWIGWDQKPLFRAFAQFFFIIIGNILLNYLFAFFWSYFYSWEPLKESELITVWQSKLMAAFLSFFISFIHTGIFLLNRWRITSEEAAELKVKTSQLQEAVTRSQLESLRLQLDPHFIFNNFSTLTELIHEDQNAAASFLENITRVYRYMISNLDKNTISVREEIDFLKAYYYLLKKRMGEKIDLIIKIDPNHLDLKIPPLTLQLLLENAVKHNTATFSNPLTVTMYSQDDQIIVKNPLQQTTGKNFVSTGIGQNNIEFRYKILFNQEPVFLESDGFYFVYLPLI